MTFELWFIYLVMSLASRIQKEIERFPEDYTFRYADLPIKKAEYATAAKALERLQAKGYIKKLSKGIFYKPVQSVFGELAPSDEEVLRDYLFENGNRVAYITGVYLYNQMMLTTQVPSTWKIAAYNKRIFVKRGKVKASPVKSYVPVTEKNYQLLGFLDALKDWNRIPDLDKKQGVEVLLNRLKLYSNKEIELLEEIAFAYPPRVLAFLGALLEYIPTKRNLKSLKENLNPLTEYQLGISFLSTAKNWNIV